MPQTPLCKAYGHVYPCGEALYGALEQAVSGVMGQEEDEPVLVREGDMARISFEGIYFPDNLAFCYSAYGRIARHLSELVHIHGYKQNGRSHSGCSHSSFTA